MPPALLTNKKRIIGSCVRGVKRPYLCTICHTTDGTKFGPKRKGICRECRKKEKRQNAKEFYIKNKNDPVRRKLHSNSRKKYKQKTIENFLSMLLERARSRRKKWYADTSVTIDQLLDIWNKQSGKCASTGMEMCHQYKKLNSVSIDRIDNDIGYVAHNVRLVCKWVNLGRLNHSADNFSILLHDFLHPPLQTNHHDNNEIRRFFKRLYRNNVQSRYSADKSKNEKAEKYDITIDYLCELYKKQEAKCAITNMQLLLQQHELCSCSIDRIDNAHGYIIGNVQLVCMWANTARGPHDINEFKTVLDDYKSIRQLAS